MLKTICFVALMITCSLGDTIPLEQTITIITIENQVDSLDKLIEKNQKNLLKDQIFQKARSSFWSEVSESEMNSFQSQLNFIIQLRKYKTDTFITDILNQFIAIKMMQKERLEILLTLEPEISNNKGIIRLHTRKVQEQIKLLYSALPMTTNEESFQVTKTTVKLQLE